ncbi:MAG TPA: HD domain-containing phosphohydrolase [Aquabacterium sp.]|nr:HD domain-containing phosphohydrolase [Aquabacterium sp.]
MDDEPLQRLLIEEILEPPQYEVVFAPTGEEGLARLTREDFDVVLTDRQMPGMNGDEFCRRVRQVLCLPMQPILMVTGSTAAEDVTDGLSSGADDLIRKPYHPSELRARVDAAVQRKRMTDQLDSTESTLFALARMVEAKDENTGDHCSRLAHKAVVLGKAMGLSAAELMALRRGGVLHDVGKLGIPDAILLKPGRLTEEEWAVMRQHTVIGHQLVSHLKSMRLTAPIIRHHHERWDGSGYPDGLAGEAIPLLARVFQLVDIHDALTYARPYKPALSQEQAAAILTDEVARGWRDPHIANVFLDLLRSEPDAMAMPDQPVDDLGVSLYANLVGSP